MAFAHSFFRGDKDAHPHQGSCIPGSEENTSGCSVVRISHAYLPPGRAKRPRSVSLDQQGKGARANPLGDTGDSVPSGVDGFAGADGPLRPGTVLDLASCWDTELENCVRKVEETQCFHVTDIVGTVFPFDADLIASRILRNPGTRRFYRNVSAAGLKKKWESEMLQGLKLHKLIHLYYTEEQVPVGQAGVREVNIRHNIFPDLKDKSISGRVKAFTTFDQIRRAIGWQLAATEYTVSDKELGITGTVDALFVDRYGIYHIVDWKRTVSTFGFERGRGVVSHLYDSRLNKFSLQLHLYRTLLERSSFLIGNLLVVGLQPRGLNVHAANNLELETTRILGLLKEGMLPVHRGTRNNYLDV